MSYVQLLSASHALDVAYAGGKGAALARLLQAGFPIPAGCAVSPQALIAYGQSHAGVAAAHTQELPPALQSGTLPQELPAELAMALRAIGPAPYGWAVRSSAVAEDNIAASFAGMYDSFLSVTESDLGACILACWASWWSERAVAYRRQVDASDSAPSMAVVMQHMVPARLAGVAFTADPISGDRSRLIINAAVGLGDAVVAGVVEPEQYTLSTTPTLSLLDRRSPHPHAAPLLSTAQWQELGGLLQRIEATCGCPQDIEWAWDGERYWIVQSRPITTLGSENPTDTPDVWGNANIKDVLPGLISPYTWSVMRVQLDEAMRKLYSQSGYTPAAERPIVRRFWGRGYFNMSLFLDAGYALGGATAADQVAQLGGAMFSSPPRQAPSWRLRLRWLGNACRFIRLVKAARQEAPRRFTTIRQQWREITPQIPQLDRPTLLERMETYGAETQKGLLLHLTLSSAMGGNFRLLQQLVTDVVPQAGPGVVADLVTGLGEVSSAEHSYHLWELSRLARQSPQVMAFLATRDWSSWRQALDGTGFLEAWEGFLGAFGHRALYESELANPRWREQPEYLFEILASYVTLLQQAPPFDPAAQARRRQAAERTVLHALPSWRRPWFRFLLRQTQTFSRLRENSRSHLAWGMDLGRLTALAAGRFLVLDGLLDTPEMVFFLEHDEVKAALRGEMPAATVQRLVTQRRLLRQRDAARQSPDLFIGERPVYGEELAPTGQHLSGLPSSPGRVTAIARVIRTPHEGERLQPGEILVAPSTDPGWTPLFLLAAGLVMETGGYLSHGAIVAREYGIPAVLNVPLATQRIPDGSRITLDGGQGLVVLATQETAC